MDARRQRRRLRTSIYRDSASVESTRSRSRGLAHARPNYRKIMAAKRQGGPAPASSAPASPMTNCKDLKVYKEGDDFVTKCRYKVKNVVGSSEDVGSMADFWSNHTGCNLFVQKCGILNCGSEAEVGGHMRVKRLKKFYFILPICQGCNMDTSLSETYQSTKKTVRLVARSRDRLPNAS